MRAWKMLVNVLECLWHESSYLNPDPPPPCLQMWSPLTAMLLWFCYIIKIYFGCMFIQVCKKKGWMYILELSSWPSHSIYIMALYFTSQVCMWIILILSYKVQVIYTEIIFSYYMLWKLSLICHQKSAGSFTQTVI